MLTVFIDKLSKHSLQHKLSDCASGLHLVVSLPDHVSSLRRVMTTGLLALFLFGTRSCYVLHAVLEPTTPSPHLPKRWVLDISYRLQLYQSFYLLPWSIHGHVTPYILKLNLDHVAEGTTTHQALPTIFSLNLFSRKVNLSLPYSILKIPLALLLLSHAKVDPFYFLPSIFGVPRTPACLFIFFKKCIYYVLK